MAVQNGKNYFQLCFCFYNLTGLRKSSTFLQKFVSMCILYPLLMIFYFMVIFNLRYKHSDIFDFAEVFNSLFAFGYLICRKTLLLVHGSLFEEMIEEYSQFWTYDLFGTSAKYSCEKNMALSLSAIKLFLIGGAVSSVVHFTAPFYIEEYSLPHACWIPGNSFAARISLYTLETIFYIEIVVIVVAFDGFYLLMCSNLKIQFALLCKAVRSIQLGTNNNKVHEEVCWKNLKEFCEYHVFLLSMHKKLNKVFSEFFICQYFFTIGGTCISLFVIFDKSSNMTQLIESICFAALSYTLVTITFIPAGEIEIEADNLTLEIYNIDWYNTKDLKVWKFVQFWLAQSQTPVQMSGAGIVRVNRQVLLQIQRLGFSVATMLTGLQ
ncbi:hypothetical protein MTP99_009634 [Tenebrio molitor]|nr:hypothetical protein MTP99_009634 [Tenebrio molitor]